MSFYVNIESLVPIDTDRNISVLSNLYQDSDLLIQKIRAAINGELTDKNIKGKKILLKPNWVRHSVSEDDELCMRTHDNFLLAAIKVIMEMKPGEILIGDAPIQGCIWDKMISLSLIDQISELSTQYKIPIFIKDFRRVTFNPSKNNPNRERNPISEYTIFDLGQNSFLEPVSSDLKNSFRVTNYNPDRLAEAHRSGVHKYCVTNDIFKADIIISLPKVKTHQKAGITAALKNIVGINGDKDFLPHHRIGGVGFGGDCYPGKNYFRLWAERILDYSNRRQGKILFRYGYKLSSLLWKLSFPKKVHQIAAGWHGNDTTWRMVLDLNKLLIFGKADGSIAEKPQRQLYSLSDGIIGGQGDGPLKPDPLPLGIIAFTNHSGMNDIVLAAIMGFDPKKIPMLKAASELIKTEEINISMNGKKTTLKELKKLAIKTIPPPGWIGYL